MSEVRRWMVVGSAAAVLVAACGGDDDGAEPAAESPSTVAPEEPASEDAEPANDEAESEGDDPAPAASEDDAGDAGDAAVADDIDFGTGVARVTIGDTVYEFDLTSGFTVCQDVFGGLQIAGASTSGEANIDMWIPPVDWETYTDGRYDPPGITVEDDTLNNRWIADANRVELLPDWPPESKVDSYSKDGNTASGSATFIDEYALDGAEPVSGTFEVACEG